MRRVLISVLGVEAGVLEERAKGEEFLFSYGADYQGPPVSLALPKQSEAYHFRRFPPFLDGLLPEGVMLEALLRQRKIDRNDPLSQLIAVGADLVGGITVEELE